MKKTILLNVILLVTSLSYGQSFTENINLAAKKHTSGNFEEALKYLDYAKKNLETLHLSSIEKDLFPEDIKGIKQTTDEINNSNKSKISGNKIYLIKEYRNNTVTDLQDITANSLVRISISNFPEKVCEFVNNFAMANNESFNMPESFSTLRINDYRAIIQYDSNMKNGRALTQIGSAIIEINAENIENEDFLKLAINKIKPEKVIKYFGN